MLQVIRNIALGEDDVKENLIQVGVLDLLNRIASK